jgi:hypothetical protein
MVNDLEQTLHLAARSFTDDPVCGCIQVLADGVFTVFRWGTCTDACKKFNGCQRGQAAPQPTPAQMAQVAQEYQ